MIVCLCKAVREREIDEHIARGARTVRELARACGAGTDCGSCVCDLRGRLAQCVRPGAHAAEGAPEEDEGVLAAK